MLTSKFFLIVFKIGKQEVSQGILAKKSVYENNQQNEVKAESKKNGATKTKKENGLTNKEAAVGRTDSDGEKTESKANIPRPRQDSESYGKQFSFFKDV